MSSTHAVEPTAPAKTVVPPADGSFTPGRPGLVAFAVFVLAALVLCWPMLTGQFLLGDDQHIAGYGFRHFAAESVKATGTVPQWNPYLFGGLPFIAAMHGDLFYPISFVLRWLFSLQTAMNLVLALHLIIAGVAAYALLRALGTNWIGAVVGGVGYEMSGIVASLVNPGHDGKLYVSALAPLAFLGLLRAIRHGRVWGYGLLSLVVAFGLFGHYQMTYYLLVASGLWTLWLVFFDPERRPDLRWPLPLAAAFCAVGLGVAASAIQALPFLSYIPHSPRAAAGPSGGWEYATSFAMPVEEVMTTILPQFNGVLEHYWGQNFFKLHTEYVGAVIVLLAAFGIADKSRGRLRWALLGIGGFFLLVAWGGHTPFYRLWYEVMPMMKKVRAAGMAFFLPALMTCIFAGFGVDRLTRRAVSTRAVLTAVAILGGIAVLGVIGVLQSVTETMASPQTVDRAVGNADALRMGSLRLLVVIVVAGGALYAIAVGKLRGGAAATALIAIVIGDLWSIDRLFFNFKEPASRLFAQDPITTALTQVKRPYRVWDPGAVYLGGGIQGGSVLMAYDIPQVLGYHGNELRYYDELLGGKGQWRDLVTANPAILDLLAGGQGQYRNMPENPTLPNLLALRYVILPGEAQLPGFHKVVGPVQTATERTGVLYERDSVPPYARVLSAALKAPDGQIAPVVQDPRFPYNQIVLYPDTVAVQPDHVDPNTLTTAPVNAEVTSWAPGSIRVALNGQSAKPSYLLVSENWYPDWHATIDGKPAAVLRGNDTFLSVVLPPGARQVDFTFDSPSYARGKLVTAVASLLILGLLLAGLRRRDVAIEARP